MNSCKRIMALILALTLMIVSGIAGIVLPTAAETINLLPNGDFEGFGKDTPVYEPWAPFEASKNSAIATVVNGVGVDGSWGLQLGSGTDAGYAKFPSAITFEEGKTYRLSFMAKGATVAGNAALVQVYKGYNVTYVNNSSNAVYLRPGKTTDEWVSYYTEFTAGANASWDKTYSLLVNRGSDTGTIVFDNFVLEEVTEESNRVTSGDFEKAYDRMWYEAMVAGKLESATKATAENANNKAIRLIATAAGWDSAWMKNMHLTKGSTYNITFDYIGGAFGMYATSKHGAFGGNKAQLSFSASDTWKTAEATFTLNADGSNDWAISFIKRKVDNQNLADTYIDNLRIVEAPKATSLELDKTTAEMEVGNEITLKATFKPEGASGEAITWKSSDDTVATVDGGKVTAVKAGTVTVTATAGTLSASCEVTVKPSSIKGGEYTLADLEGHYKTQGRIYKTNSRLYLDWSASGFEFSADCSGDVYVTFQVESINATYGCYFTVIIDGVDQGRTACHLTQNGTQKVKIASNLPEGKHRFEIYRQSAIGSTVSINAVTLDGTLLDAPKKNDVYIEFVGDSITVAQSNLYDSSMSSTGTPLDSNAMQGYAYMTAHDKLGVDFSLVAVSGIGASVGWTNYSMQAVYPKLRYPKDSATAYDFARQPDVVVLALGTNDLNRYTYHDKTLADVKQGFKDMLAMVQANNPNAKVVWIHGMMLSSSSSIIKEVVAEAGGSEAGVYELRLPQNNKGGNGHPNVSGHIEYANQLSAYLSDLLKPEAPVVKTQAATSVALEAVTGYEYSCDGETWQSEPTFSDLAAGTYYFYQRKAETADTNAGFVSAGTKVVVEGEHRSGWVQDGDKWYYYEDGAMVKNAWRLVDGKWYFLNEDGAMASNAWKKDSKGWVYLGSSGAMLTNAWCTDSQGWCYVGANGYAVTNCWKQDSYGWIWLNANGSMTKNAWIKDGGKWYFLDANGYMVSNAWRKDSKGWVYLGSSGAMLTNAWCTDSKGWCYVGADGYAVTNCWKKDSVGWIWLDANGSMTKLQWLKEGNNWYYLNANGYMVTGTHVIGGRAYTFGSNGVWDGK